MCLAIMRGDLLKKDAHEQSPELGLCRNLGDLGVWQRFLFSRQKASSANLL